MIKKPKYLQSHAPIQARVEDLLKRMTLEEKAAQLRVVFKEAIADHCEKENGDFNSQKAGEVLAHGLGRISVLSHTFTPRRSAEIANEVQKFALEKTRLGIPVLIDTEALHGCMGLESTSYPQAIGLAATWNTELLRRIAVAIGREARARGACQVLSPVCDIARDARAGRTEESYGEDPLLVSRMAVAYVTGVQSQRVVTTPKHFAANFVGDGGRDSHAIHFSERLLREIYLAPYEAVIKEAGALSVMSAYHSLDGVPCSANKWLLTGLLRGEWGFKGVVVSDWAATEQIHTLHCVAENKAEAARKALNAGMDVELPYSDCFKHIVELVKTGRLSRKVLDQAVKRALYVKFWSGIFEQPYVNPEDAVKITNCPAHRALALEAARQSVVLLQNDGFLPLSPALKTVAVIGPNAAKGRLGGYSTARTQIVSPLDGIKKFVSPQTEVLYAEGCPLKEPNREGFAEALRIAKQADAVLLFMGNSTETEGEQKDRSNLDLPGTQEDLILEVAQANPNVAVVLIGGSAVTMTRWIDKVRAIVLGWYPGQEGGTALAEILFGAVNPSGKLPITFPKVTGQCPLYYNAKPSGRIDDYADLRGRQPQFSFGHGLSYTEFEYQTLRVRKSGAGKNLKYAAAAQIKNVGRRAGDEVVQLYIRDEYSGRSRPAMELKGFQRISLKPGQKTIVRFKLAWRDLAYLGDDLKPTLEPGNIELIVGRSSQDIRLRFGSQHTGSVEAETYDGSPLQPAVADIREAAFPSGALRFTPVQVMKSGPMRYTDFRAIHGNQHGLIYLRTNLTMRAKGKGQLLFGADGPVRAWLNGQPVFCAPNASNPILRDTYQAPVRWKEGFNEAVFAIHTNHGKAWGVTCRGTQG